MMINDDDVCFLRAISHARDEARIEVRTFLPETGFRASVDVTPERERLRKVRELGPIAGFTISRPVTDLVEVIDLVEAFEYRRRLGARETIQAEVVAAALHVSGRERFREDALEKGNVFLHQLLLQIFSAGGD